MSLCSLKLFDCKFIDVSMTHLIHLMFQTIYFDSVLQNTNPEKGYFEKPKQGMPKNYVKQSGARIL